MSFISPETYSCAIPIPMMAPPPYHHPHPHPPSQLSRAFESFGRFLALRQDLVAPLVTACLSTMMLLPLEQPGHLPPPTPITTAWKRKFDARLSMCAAVTVLAKVGLGDEGNRHL